MGELDISKQEHWAQMQASSSNDSTRALKSGGGDGTSGDMEARVAKLEATTEHIQRDLADVKTDVRDTRDRLGKLEVKVDHLPTKGWVDARIVFLLVAIGAVVTFQGHIQAWLGIVPHP